MLCSAVTLAHPDPAKDMCVFTDASQSHWGSVITQCEPGALSLPLGEQQHEPLIFLSGAFKGSSLKWPIIDKEAFAIVNTLDRCEYLLQRERGIHIFTDHRNLIYLPV